MKRISIVFIVVLLLLFNTTIFAQDATSSASPSAAVAPKADLAETPTPAPYLLPYPGILPDHPLWLVKALRDNIISLLIADPAKKAEFNLLQADKRIAAAEALFKKGKIESGVSTISKAGNYFEQAVVKTEEAKASGKDVAGFLIRLSEGAQKHQEVILSLEEGQEGGARDALARERGRVEEQGKKVDSLRSQ